MRRTSAFTSAPRDRRGNHAQLSRLVDNGWAGALAGAGRGGFQLFIRQTGEGDRRRRTRHTHAACGVLCYGRTHAHGRRSVSGPRQPHTYTPWSRFYFSPCPNSGGVYPDCLNACAGWVHPRAGRGDFRTNPIIAHAAPPDAYGRANTYSDGNPAPPARE